jgi:hypothetical protein
MDTPITITTYEEEQNLTHVTWNQRFLDKVKDTYNLKHREAVLYVNKANDRFRLVACFYGLAVLILPPTSTEARLSLYLQVSQFLRKFAKNNGTLNWLDLEVESATARVTRRARLAEAADRRK